MISYFVRKKIEFYYGASIKYPKDCVSLAHNIYSKTKSRISNSTLMRAFGIVESKVCPRLHTLDIIANYINYKDWYAALEGDKLTQNDPFDLTNVIPQELPKNQLVKLMLNEIEIELLFLESGSFMVLSSKNFCLNPSDILNIFRIEKDFYLVCENVIRDGKNLGPFFSEKNFITKIFFTN